MIFKGRVLPAFILQMTNNNISGPSIIVLPLVLVQPDLY